MSVLEMALGTYGAARSTRVRDAITACVGEPEDPCLLLEWWRFLLSSPSAEVHPTTVMNLRRLAGQAAQ
eukprot:gene15847-8293_t